MKAFGGGCVGCFTAVFLFFGISICVVAALCGASYFYIQQNAPQPPIANFTPQAAQAQSFESAINRAADSVKAAQQANPGSSPEFSVSVSELEASSWLSLKSDSVNADEIQNIQVRFRNGAIGVYFEANIAGVTVPTEVAVQTSIGADGRLLVSIQNVDLGGFSFDSQGTQQSINDEIQAAIDKELAKIGSTNYRITSLNSSDGTLTVRGIVGQ